ncbi:MAG: hypothetical protein LC111_00335 [Bacteroidia bacterium]|nr:hypothetical protein [Bacteroidia bacterium]
MQDNLENNTNNSLVPLGSKGLVRLENSIAITRKILKDSELLFHQFEGKISNTIKINQESYINYVGNINNDVYFINKYGTILKINIIKNVVFEISNISDSYEKSMITKFLVPPEIVFSSYIYNNKIYISNRSDKIIIYDLLKEKTQIHNLNQNIEKNNFIDYYSFLPFKNMIFSFCEEFKYSSIDKDLEWPTRGYYIRIFNKEKLHLKHRFKAIEKFYYFKLSFSNGYLYSINQVGIEEHKGKILKQSLENFTYSFLNAFESSWIEEYELLNENTIICYSNYVFGNNDSLLRIIDSINNKIIFEIRFEEIIRRFTLSKNKNILALLFNDGKVLMYILKNSKLELINQFQYNELIETDYEVTPIHIHPPPNFEFILNKLIIGDRKQINIYK